MVGNPWTFPFIWIWIYQVGRWILGNSYESTVEELDFSRFFGEATEALLSLDVAHLFETTWPVLLPMIVGGIPNAIIAWFVFYLPLKPMVAAYQRRRRMRLMKKAVAKTQEISDESAA
ncbi:MAG: DUF2062 domain-containing protein [Rhodospirillales bacterium]|nr:DUF2062 domain-containing protein [Rhodospirillales bacterium]